MRTGRKWQVGLVCVVLMALLAPAALAEDPNYCGQPFQFITNEPNAVIDCATGYTIVSNSTVNLLPGAHISNAIGGGAGAGILSVDYGTTNTINIHGGQIGAMLNFGPFDTVTVYGSSFDPVDPIEDILVADPTKIENISTDPVSPVSFTLTGFYEDGISSCSLPCVLEGGAVLNLEWLGGPSVIDVVIDIKPDSADNTINLGSKGIIPVAILTDESFDATLVDPNSLFLGGASVAVRGKSDKWMSHEEDVDADGDIDLMLQFNTLNFDPNVVQEGPVYLEGTLYDGTPIKGEDSIIVVPQ